MEVDQKIIVHVSVAETMDLKRQYPEKKSSLFTFTNIFPLFSCMDDLQNSLLLLFMKKGNFLNCNKWLWFQKSMKNSKLM